MRDAGLNKSIICPDRHSAGTPSLGIPAICPECTASCHYFERRLPDRARLSQAPREVAQDAAVGGLGSERRDC